MEPLMNFRTYGQVRKVCKSCEKIVLNLPYWRLLELTTCCFIILNAIANHGWGLLG